MDKFSLQETLSNNIVKIRPLEFKDFESLFFQSSDPEVWSQHPNKLRYKRKVFQNFFDGAMASEGAFAIIDLESDTIIGSTRFYDFDEKENSILIGYTFYGKKFWGKNYNAQVKKLMLDYVFKYLGKVIFHVGSENFRSQKAMEKLGAEKLGELEVAYFGEASKLNIVYQIEKDKWFKKF